MEVKPVYEDCVPTRNVRSEVLFYEQHSFPGIDGRSQGHNELKLSAWLQFI